MGDIRNNNGQEQGTRKGKGEGRRGVKTTSSASTKATMACMEYAHLTAMIREVGKGIGKHLGECPGVLGTLRRQTIAELPDSDDQTHMSAYFTMARGGWDRQSTEQMRRGMEACPHCAAANQLVQYRKTLRQRIGASKRAIVAAAKAAHAEANLPDPDEQARALFLSAQGDLFQQKGGAAE